MANLYRRVITWMLIMTDERHLLSKEERLSVQSSEGAAGKREWQNQGWESSTLADAPERTPSQLGAYQHSEVGFVFPSVPLFIKLQISLRLGSCKVTTWGASLVLGWSIHLKAANRISNLWDLVDVTAHPESCKGLVGEHSHYCKSAKWLHVVNLYLRPNNEPEWENIWFGLRQHFMLWGGGPTPGQFTASVV